MTANALDTIESGPLGAETVTARARATPTHCGITVSSLYGWLLPSLLFPMAAGALFLGWRALIAVGLVVGSTVVGVTLWRLVGQRGRGMHMMHAVYLGGLLAMLMPAELASFGWPGLGVKVGGGGVGVGWPLLVGAGFTLSAFYWLLGGVGARVHPVAITALALLVAFSPPVTRTPLLTPTAVLARPHLFTGDVLWSRPWQASLGGGEYSADPQLTYLAPPEGPPAVRMEPAATRLTDFTSPAAGALRVEGNPAEGGWLSLTALLRDRLPPLEDLVVGGHPGAVGLTSMAALLAGGLVLLYRGGADWRVPLIVIVTATVAFVCLRLPVVVTGSGPVWRWFAFREPGVTWEVLLTFACYQLAAGPLVFMALYLATAGASTPTSRRARLTYAALLGPMAAAGQLYLSVPAGPLVALVLLSLATPLMDRWLRSRPLL